MNAKQAKLTEKHGTPEGFAVACDRAADQGVITTAEAESAKAKYNTEWADAGLESEDTEDDEPRKTQTASRSVWWIIRLAMNLPYPRPVPKVGDTVVETTHCLGLARHRLGLHKALGELLAVEKGEYGGERYLIKSFDPAEGETWWENAMIVRVEERIDARVLWGETI